MRLTFQRCAKTRHATVEPRKYTSYFASNAVGDVKEDQGGPARGPIPLLVGNLIPNFAQQLSTEPSSIANLPAPIAAVHQGWNNARSPKLVAIGHSLGGAVLGNAASRSDTGLSRIVLLGVSKLVDAGFPFGLVPPIDGATSVPLVFLRGDKDGLAKALDVVALSSKYPNSEVAPSIAGVNHFCIIDGLPGDAKLGTSTVGAPGKRAEDAVSPLPTVEACVDATIASLKPYLD